MKSVKLLPIIAIWVCLASAVLADDLAMVDLSNKFQESIVRQVVDKAYTRVDNSFLVSLSAEQADLLMRAGIKYEYVMIDFDEANVALVSRDRMTKDEPLPASLGSTKSLRADLSLAEIDESAARQINESEPVHVTPLSSLDVRIFYLPEAITNMALLAGDFPTDSLADQVDIDSMTVMLQRLVDFQTRYIYTDSIEAARDWLVQKFLSWGYTDVSTPTFTYYGYTLHNVMCVKQGYAEPDKVIVIGGHYDSITYGQPTPADVWAPGADDDGTGTILTLELARILADVPLRKTVIFMPFSAEEVGLVGSRAAAAMFAANGTDIEVMYNFDMVAYEPNANWYLNLSSGPNTAYRELLASSMGRVSNVTPVITTMGSSSDHYAFYEQGFNISDQIENTFNYNGWHTDTDIIDSLNLPYYRDVTRAAISAVSVVANAAHPTDIDQLVDQGDGQAIEIVWSDCDPNYDYTVYYGPAGSGFTDSINVSAGLCALTVTGLTEGQEYSFGVVGSVADGYPAVYTSTASQTPLVVPRTPLLVTAEPALDQVSLDWADNAEADFDHYRLYRSYGDLPLSLYQDNVSVSGFQDYGVQGQVGYHYAVTSVDADGYESDKSYEVYAVPATFDGGVLLVDDMKAGQGLPTETGQGTYFDGLFGDVVYYWDHVDTTNAELDRNTAGQFSSMFWFDDDLSHKLIVNSEDSLAWYSSFTDNIMLTGMRTLEFWVASPLHEGHVIYDDFKVSGYTVQSDFDFIGANGLNGFPSAVADPGAILYPLPYVETFDLVDGPGVVPIFTYDSQTDNPDSEGEVCGVLYNGPDGYRIILGFPLYWLTDESAQAIVQYALTLFNESSTAASEGDANSDGRFDIADLVFLASYFFNNGPAPLTMNAADVDGSCRLDIADIVYMVQFMFHSGSALQTGCVE